MKKIIGIALASLCFAVSAFAQSAEYSKHLAKAKEYEQKKQWAFALDSYYDAIGCADEPSQKVDALNGYQALSSAIKSGNPGLGSYNSFTIHDEWKKLLMDAEKLGSSICKYEVRLGKLERGDLNYETKTATYKSKVSFDVSDRYKKTIGVIDAGYEAAYKSDWKDLPGPEYWPLRSVSSAKNAAYDVEGAKIFSTKFITWDNADITEYLNAFCFSGVPAVWGNHYHYSEMPDACTDSVRTLYDYKFNIVDENGKELVKGKRWLLHTLRYADIPSDISIDGITPEIMDLIDNGKAFINPVAVYLKYGKYNPTDDGLKQVNYRFIGDARSFVKNLPEVQLDMSKAMIYCWNKTEDLKASRFVDAYKAYKEYVIIPLVKSYFEKISANTDYMNDWYWTGNGWIQKAGAKAVLIKLGGFYSGWKFNLKGKELKEEEFLAILEKITNKKYAIGNAIYSSDYCLIRNMTAEEIEEITPSKKSKRR